MESRSNDLDVFSELSSSARHALARESVRNDARESLSRSEPSRNETSARAREIEKKKKREAFERERGIENVRSLDRCSLSLSLLSSLFFPTLLLPHPELHRAHRLELGLHGLAVAEEVVLHLWTRRKRKKEKESEEEEERGEMLSSFFGRLRV